MFQPSWLASVLHFPFQQEAWSRLGRLGFSVDMPCDRPPIRPEGSAVIPQTIRQFRKGLEARGSTNSSGRSSLIRYSDGRGLLSSIAGQRCDRLRWLGVLSHAPACSRMEGCSGRRYRLTIPFGIGENDTSQNCCRKAHGYGRCRRKGS